MYLVDMFTYSDLMPFDPATPVWRVEKTDLSSKSLYTHSDEIMWVDPKEIGLPAFFCRPFPIVSEAFLQFLLSQSEMHVEYQPITITHQPAGQYYRLFIDPTASYEDMLADKQPGKKIWILQESGWFFISPALKTALEQTDIKGIECVPGMTFTRNNGYYDYLIHHFSKAHQQHDINALCKLVESARARGRFLPDYEEKIGTLFNLLLQISIDLLQTTAAYESSELWFFIAEVYDIQFHQVQLDEYPAETARLYFELTRNVLQPHFHPLNLDKEKKVQWYGSTLYFIKMASGYFERRPDEFFTLYPLILPLCNNPEYHLDGYWLESYKDLTE